MSATKRHFEELADRFEESPSMTVAQLRGLLAGLPPDAEIRFETEGDYPTWAVVYHAGIPFALERFRPGESIPAMLDRSGAGQP